MSLTKWINIKPNYISQRMYLSINTIRNERMYSTGSNFQSIEDKTDFTRFLSQVGLRRKPSLVRELTSLLAKAEPGTIFMAGGFPNSDLFPFKSMTIQMSADKKLHFTGKQLAAALQYQPSLGYPPLLETLKKMQVHFHKPPQWDNKDIIVTIGSQHGISSVIEMTINTGDPILVPMPAYASLLTITDPHLPKYLGVKGDANGILPSELKKTIDFWSHANDLRRKPKILYLNPTGTNPSGTSISTARKKEIYKIAQEYDLLILDDDPYYFLHFDDKNPTSFLSMDVDNRVIRFDSFSKIISSGLRIGFATGPKPLIRKIELSLQASVLQAPSLSQVIVDGVLREWDIPGFLKHTENVRRVYQGRRDMMINAASKHLNDLAEWTVPKGGMFLWIKVKGVKDTYSMVMKHGFKKGIILLPGRECFPDRKAPCPYLRASFSVVSEEEMNKGFQILAYIIRDERKRQ